MDRERLIGCILGTAAGDSLGLPYEGLSPRRAARLLGAPQRHRLVFGRGMISDDTEHAVIVARSLIRSNGEVEGFAHELARGLKFWLLCLPGGVGFATLRATLKLWAGVRPDRSGVFSAGNGPAMRAPLLGLAARDGNHLQALVECSTRMTHRDPKAYFGALAIAVGARLAADDREIEPQVYLREIVRTPAGADAEFIDLLSKAVRSAEAGGQTQQFASELGLGRGVTGYVYHTVPVCVQAWLSHQNDFRGAVQSVILCGGDADTTAAITGGIVGAHVGEKKIPTEWLEGIMEWPWNVAFLCGLAEDLHRSIEGSGASRSHSFEFARAVRNVLFIVVVLGHGVRRLAPPY